MRKLVCFLILIAASLSCAVEVATLERRKTPPDASFAYVMLDIMQEVTGNEVERIGTRPTIISRQMAMIVNAMYDAWACYDDKAVGVCFGGTMRRPPAERTLDNKKKAIAYAMYRVMEDVFPNDIKYATEQMIKFGYDPNNQGTDPATPEGIGNRIAATICESRHKDGANQLGDEVGSNGKPYSDYTYYKPCNPPDSIVFPDHWKPIQFDDGKGGKVSPGFLTPHWYRVKPFALKKPEQFRPGPPELLRFFQRK